MDDLQGEQLKKFQQQRDTLLAFIRNKAHPVLKQVEKGLGRNEEYDLPEKQLAEASYTLALVGAFQSGKSTLFNYLCDGRELSPSGPNGGGIRTSGCRVAAHPLRDGEEEYALVTWRSAKDLLNSFGEVLQTEYKSINELNLDDDACREELKKKAWELIKEHRMSEDSELLRFVMLVAHFYPEYAERCKKGEWRCTPEEATEFSSYPQKWAERWRDTRRADGDLSAAFTAKEVAFAFCGGVDLYLNSEILKKLGCSIVDCPGFFASKWDTQIANECIAEANAILYMFKGDTSMSQGDLDTLRDCVKSGGKEKIIFGANLYIDRDHWKDIDGEISAELENNGFSDAVVHAFHAALALRSRELFYLKEIDTIAESSRHAIELELKRPCNDETIAEHITDQLKKYLARLRGSSEKINDEELDPVELENESGAPAFLRAANNMVIARRGRSILVENGIRRVYHALELADKDIKYQLELLSGSIEEARANLDRRQQAINRFEIKRQNACRALKDRITVASEAIAKHYKQEMERTLRNSDPRLLKTIEEHLVSWSGTISEKFSQQQKEERLQRFSKAIRSDINNLSRKIFDNLRDSFSGLAEVASVRHTFEDQRSTLMEEITKLKDIPDMNNIVPEFPKDFTENVSSRVIKDVTDNLLKEEMGIGSWFLSLLGGVSEFIRGDRERAKDVFNEFRPKLRDALSKSLAESLSAEKRKGVPAGPMRAIWDLYTQFSAAFEEPARLFEQNKKSLERALAEAHKDGEKMKKKLTPLKEQVTHLLTECTDLKAAINKDFPPHQQGKMADMPTPKRRS